MRLQWCGAPAPRFGRAAARLPKALDPDNCGAGTNRKFLGRLAPRSSTFDLRNHSLPHLPRIGLWHRPASQKRINADSLSHPRPHENPPDSIGAEHALVLRFFRCTTWGIRDDASSPTLAVRLASIHPFATSRIERVLIPFVRPVAERITKPWSFRLEGWQA